MGGLVYFTELYNYDCDLQNHSPISQLYIGPINKLIINNDSSFCPITHEQIDVGEKYMSCHQCKKCFSEVAIKHWLESRMPDQMICPWCRVKWSNYEIYVNREESLIETESLHPPTTT